MTVHIIIEPLRRPLPLFLLIFWAYLDHTIEAIKKSFADDEAEIDTVNVVVIFERVVFGCHLEDLADVLQILLL